MQEKVLLRFILGLMVKMSKFRGDMKGKKVILIHFNLWIKLMAYIIKYSVGSLEKQYCNPLILTL